MIDAYVAADSAVLRDIEVGLDAERGRRLLFCLLFCSLCSTLKRNKGFSSYCFQCVKTISFFFPLIGWNMCRLGSNW